MPRCRPGWRAPSCSSPPGPVLVLEILAGRLLAPYVGVRLETYTAVIGVVLAGISIGTWLGGRLADRVDPRRTLGPLMMAGGALAMLSPAAVRAAGHPGVGTADDIIGLAVIGFFLPSAVLSRREPDGGQAAAPRTSTSPAPSSGACRPSAPPAPSSGRFVAGFVLVAAAATATVILAVGASLVAAGLALWIGLALVPAPGDHGGRGAGRRPRRRGAGRGVGRAMRRRDPLPLRPGHPRPRPGGRAVAVARHPPPQLRRPERPPAPRGCATPMCSPT